MKAIQITEYGGPEVLNYVDLPVPTPGPGEVLVRIQAIGVGKPDVLLRTGVYKWKPPLPSVVGCEGAGVVEALGEGVGGLAIGDTVLVMYKPVGCYAEYAVAPVTNVFPLPAGFDPQLAIHVPNYITAYALLNDGAQSSNAKTLYINGSAGGLGVAMTHLAALRGISVIAGASSDEKCAFVRSHGAAHTINYGKVDVIPEVLRLTDGRGVDLIYDQMIGPAFTDTFEMLAPLGTIVSFNVLKGLPAQDLFAAMRANLTKSPAVRCFSGHVYDDRPHRLREIHAEVVRMLERGTVRPSVHAVLPLAQARQAHEMLDGREVMGKLALTP